MFILLFYLAIIFFYLNLSVGVYALVLFPKQKTHINLFILQVLLALINLGFIAFHLTKSLSTLAPMFQHFTSVTALVPMLIFFLSLHLTNIIPLKTVHYLLIPIPAVTSAIVNSLVSPYADLSYDMGCWRFNGFESDLLFNIHILNYVLYILLFTVTILIWYKKTHLKREKKQAIILLISVVSAVTVYVIYQSAINNRQMITPDIAGSGHLLAIIWTAGFWLCIVKYRLFPITPELVSRDIIENINESVILLGNDKKIIFANTRTKTLINNDKPKGMSIQKVIAEYEAIEKAIAEIYEGTINDFSCRVNYLLQNKQQILVDTKISVIRDKFNDIIGMLIIGHEVRELKQLKNIFNITDKESDIIQLIVNGSTTKEISEEAGITESTVKTHLTNIYNKFGVDNKIQLLHQLKEFNLIPEQKSDKILLITNESS